jgi:hypothetical protein
MERKIDGAEKKLLYNCARVCVKGRFKRVGKGFLYDFCQIEIGSERFDRTRSGNERIDPTKSERKANALQHCRIENGEANTSTGSD